MARHVNSEVTTPPTMTRNYRDGSLPDLIPVRMLNEFAYCSRLFYLEWVQCEFEESVDTLQGTYRHRRVDKETSSISSTTPSNDQAGNESPESEDDRPQVHERSLTLSAPQAGLIAKMDLVDMKGDHATPVDYKRGRVPKTPDQAWEPEKVQLCAQGIILRENGYASTEGIIYYVESKRRVTIRFDEALIDRTLELIQELRRTAEAGSLPPPLVDSPKCPRCSLVGICLPDEVNMLKRNSQSTDEARRMHPAKTDALPAYILDQGARVGKSGDRLTVKNAQETLQEMRIHDISHLCLFGNVQISTQALRYLCQEEIPICHYSYGGWFTGITQGFPHKNIELRWQQFETARDTDRSLALARPFVAGKIHNSRTLLRRNHEGDLQPALDELTRLRDSTRNARHFEQLLGIEGAAAKVYFGNFSGMLSSNQTPAFSFQNRNRRPPRDPVNALLSFGYALLTTEMTIALLATGFDPYLGFYHQPRYGRPALSLDIAEEFRSLVVDSTVLTVLNNQHINPSDFIRRAGGVTLKDPARKKFIKAYEQRMATEIRHPLFRYALSYRRILAVQCRLLARYLLGETDEYASFRTR